MTDPGIPVGLARLKVVGWAGLYLATGFALMVVLYLAIAALAGDLTSTANSARSLAWQTIAGLIAYGFMTWALGMKGLGLTLSDLRWRSMQRPLRGLGLGLGLGIVPASLAIGLSLILGGAGFAREPGNFAAYLSQVGLTVLLLAPAALLEEIMFRGVAQVALARAFGRLPAILGLSLAFAAAHLRNPNTTALALVNIAVAGVLLGLAFYLPGGIWTAWGTHLGWNATLAAFDAPVSGLPFRIPLIDYLPGGPSWLTGGPFGPEGGLLATVALAGAMVVAWRGGRKELA